MRASRWTTDILASLTTMAAAGVEARLAGRATITLDDLLVGLLLTGGPATRVLTRHGASVEGLRKAVAGRDADDLASLGLDPSALPAPKRLPFPEAWRESREMALAPGIEDLLSSAQGERALLTALLTHASGGPAAALERSGVSVAEVLADEDWAPVPSTSRPRGVPELLDGPTATTQVSRFIAAGYEDVRELVRDPARLHEWLMPGERLADGGDGDGAGAGRAGLAEATEGIFGTPREEPAGAWTLIEHSSRKGTACQRLDRVLDEPRGEGWRVAWLASWVDQPAREPRTFLLVLDLRPDGPGTAVRLTRQAHGWGPLAWAGRAVARAAGAVSAASETWSLAQLLHASPAEPRP